MDRAPPRLAAGVTLIDSHCHLDMASFDVDREETIRRARDTGIGAIITIGAGGPFECNHRAIRLAETNPDVYATVGIHPHDAGHTTDQTILAVEDLARSPRVVAIGETGLDFHYDNSPRPVQEEAFRRFVALARRLRRPLVVHVRDAYERAAELLRQEGADTVGGVLHCFSGDRPAARRFLDLGFHLSFSGILTFKNAQELREVAKKTPEDRLLVETDAPFLAPVPMRGRRNEPAFVLHTAACLASLRNQPLEVIAEATSANTRRLFRLLS